MLPIKLSLKSSSRFYIPFLSVLILVPLVFGGLLYFQKIYAITNVQVITSGQQKDLKGVSELKGKNIILTSDYAIQKTILKSNYDIRSVTVQKKFPDTIYLSVVQYQPQAYLQGDSGYFVLADDGYVLSRQKDQTTPLPLIHFYEKLNFFNYNVGSSISYTEVKATIKWLQIIKEAGYVSDTVDINGPNMLAFTVTNDKGLAGRKIIVSTEKDFDQQKYELETIVKKFRIDGHDFKTLDLRFNRPVITF